MLRSLYSTRKIVVWVEDELTKEYLSALWRDKRIGFAVAAGREGVSALTNDARSGSDQRTNVFGVRDKDFGETNFPDWTNPDTYLFILPRHEIENYLLDWDALKAYGDERLGTDARKQVKRDAREIERRVKKRAAKLTWWAACKKMLSELHAELASEFPRDPTQEEITCLVGALNYILKTNDWHRRVCNLPCGPLDANSISNSLTRYHDERMNELLRTTPGRDACLVNRFTERRGHTFEVHATRTQQPPKRISTWPGPSPIGRLTTSSTPRT